MLSVTEFDGFVKKAIFSLLQRGAYILGFIWTKDATFKSYNLVQ